MFGAPCPRLFADDSGITPQAVQVVQEADGSPVCAAPILEVSNATLTDNSATGKCTVTTGGGGSVNSFETIAVPAGTNPVADSSTDTLTITETSPLVITGTAATDTIDITMTTSPASAATVVGTGRLLTGGTGIAVLGDLSADRTVTVDATELEALTWGAGGNASNAWTFDLSGTDDTLTFASGLFRFGNDVSLDGANPKLVWRDTTTNLAYAAHVDNAATTYQWALFRGTDTGTGFNVGPSHPLLAFDSSDNLYLTSQLASCDNTKKLATNALGQVVCSTDQNTGGGSSGTVTSITAGTGLSGGTITTSGTISLSTPVSVANGGTGDTTLTSNGVLYGQGASAVAITAQGGSNTVLTANAGAPSFSTSPTLTSMILTDNLDIQAATPTLKLTDTTASQRDFEFYADTNEVQLTDVTNGITLFKWDAANRLWFRGDTVNYRWPTSDGSTGQRLATDGSGRLAWSSVGLTSDVTGTLPIANGGTSTTTFTSNGVLYGNTTSAIQATAQGPTNSVLTASAGAPSFSATPTVTTLAVTNNVQFLPASGTQFEQYASGSQWFLTNLTNGTVLLNTDGADNLVSARRLTLTDGKLRLPSGVTPYSACAEGELFMDTDATSGQRLYACQGSTFVLQGDGGGGGSGDVTDVGDCSTGACFTAAGTGTSLTPPAGTLTVAGDLTISENSTPTLELNNTGAGSGNFELYINSSQLFLSNKTTGNVMFRTNGLFTFPLNTWDFKGATLRGIVPDRELNWPGPAMLPLEFSADAIPPIVKTAGTNVDTLTVDYDDSSLECRQVIFRVPDTIDTTAKWTFRIWWYASTQATANVVWDIRFLNRTTGQTWDAALSQFGFPLSAANTSANFTVEASMQRTVTELGATANNYILCAVCRNGAQVGDTLVGDAKIKLFSITMPRLR